MSSIESRAEGGEVPPDSWGDVSPSRIFGGHLPPKILEGCPHFGIFKGMFPSLIYWGPFPIKFLSHTTSYIKGGNNKIFASGINLPTTPRILPPNILLLFYNSNYPLLLQAFMNYPLAVLWTLTPPLCGNRSDEGWGRLSIEEGWKIFRLQYFHHTSCKSYLEATLYPLPPKKRPCIVN